MRRVLLNTGIEGRRVAWLRTPTGADELAADGGADLLLDRCLVERGDGTVAPGMARRLPLADRDRLLLTLQRMLFGDQVQADAPCTACGESFSLDFSLAALLDAHHTARPDDVAGPDAAGHYCLHDITFRLPTSEDLDRAAAIAGSARFEPPDAAPAEQAGTGAGTAARALLDAVVIAGDAAGREAELEVAMAALGPVLDVDLDATCPHCANGQRPRFSIGPFLEQQLANERRFVLREVHRLARAYGWSCASILELPRADRHAFALFIEGELPRSAEPLVQAGTGW